MSHENISAILFDFTRRDQLQFEVATSSILSAATLATAPGGVEGYIIRAAALLLPIIAVFHWSVDTARFSDADVYLKRSYRLVEFLGIIVISHIIHLIISSLFSNLPIFTTPAIAYLIGSVTLALVCILFIEFVYRAYQLFWGTAMFMYAISAADSKADSDDPINIALNSFLSNFTAQMAYLLLRNNIPEGNTQGLQDLRKFVTNVEKEVGTQNDLSGRPLFAVAAVITIPTFAILSYLLSASVITIPFFDVLIVLIATRITKHVIEVPALIFGTLSFADFLQSNVWSLLTISTYTCTVYTLFIN